LADVREQSTTSVADLVVHELVDGGVRALFGVPGGGGNLDLIAAAGRAGLPFVLTATETAAALAAMAQAEVTGGPGACLTTLGPGAASAVNGVACAFLDRSPLLVLTDAFAGGAASPYEHQRLDQAALFTPLTKASMTLASDAAARTIRRGIGIATSGCPGPVHLDCPAGVAGVALSEEASAGPDETVPRVQVSAEERSRFESLVSRAKKPLLIVGLGARRQEDADAIRAFCERRRIPALVTYKAKGVVPDEHPLFAGVFTNALIEQAVIAESDLLIGVGLDPVELLPRAWKRERPIVVCGRWPVETAHVPFAAQWIGEIPDAVAHLDAILGESAWTTARVRAHAIEQQRAVSIGASGMTAHRVVEIAAARLASRAGRVTVDAGAHMFPATVLWPVRDPSGMLISNGLSTMGFALPAAVGAALLDRERPTVALTGDGGLLMCAGELLTAARERLRVITIVFNDASLSLIEIKQQARQLPAAGVALGEVNWAALAESVGVKGVRANDDASLIAAIDGALACDGPSLIDARIDRSNYPDTLRAVRGGI
jgi:acetolactate synthase-1/2/3 large subunit